MFAVTVVTVVVVPVTVVAVTVVAVFVVAVIVVTVVVVVVVVAVVVVVVVVAVVVVDVDLMQQSTRKVFGTEFRYSKPGSAFNQWSQFVSPVSVTPSDSYIICRGKQ